MCGRRARSTMTGVTTEANAGQRRAAARLAVHLGLIATVVVSLVFEPELTLHIVIGFVFVGLVLAHLVQRKRVTSSLAARLFRGRGLLRPAGRLALSDALLVALTLAMLGSGLWDWLTGHPTRIRWHAITGVVLTGYLIVHTVRRRHRLASSHVR
jgi:hypothetical protein